MRTYIYTHMHIYLYRYVYRHSCIHTCTHAYTACHVMTTFSISYCGLWTAAPLRQHSVRHSTRMSKTDCSQGGAPPLGRGGLSHARGLCRGPLPAQREAAQPSSGRVAAGALLQGLPEGCLAAARGSARTWRIAHSIYLSMLYMCAVHV